MDTRVAIIDLGSNSVRMSINLVRDDGSWVLLKKVRETVRLSENMNEDKYLKKESVERVIKALKEFSTLSKEYGCDSLTAIATEAVRSAVNKDKFLLKAKQETGIEFNVISGEDEAYYSFLAVKSTIGIDDGVIMDTGGGSTEISIVKNGKLIKSVSLPLGAVVMTERMKNQPQTELYRYVANNIENIEWISQCDFLPLYAIGGSARAAAMLYVGRLLPSGEIDKIRISYNSFERLYQTIYSTPLEKRKDIPGMDVSRADIILAGLTPAKAFMDITKSPFAQICLAGVKEGVFFKIRDEILTKGSVKNKL